MTNITLRQLEYAVAIADHQSFSHAAQAVHVSQPGLSGQIQELERRLGVALFERGPRAVRLTSAGEEVVGRARHILGQADELVLVASLNRGVLRGRLRLAAIPTMGPYLLPPLIRAVQQHWPDADLVLQERQSEDLLAAISRGDVDMGLLALPFATGELRIEPVDEEPFLLAVPEGHVLDHPEPLPLDELADLPMLLLEKGHCLRDHIITACEAAGPINQREMHTASLSTLTQMVASGVGLTLLPASAVAVEARPGTGVTTRPFEPPVPSRTVALAWRATDPRDQYFTALADYLRSSKE